MVRYSSAARSRSVIASSASVFAMNSDIVTGFQRSDERAGAHVPLNHPWRGSAMVPSELATALAAFNPDTITMG